jgi:hypothetical protein
MGLNLRHSIETENTFYIALPCRNGVELETALPLAASGEVDVDRNAGEDLSTCMHT